MNGFTKIKWNDLQYFQFNLRSLFFLEDSLNVMQYSKTNPEHVHNRIMLVALAIFSQFIKRNFEEVLEKNCH